MNDNFRDVVACAIVPCVCSNPHVKPCEIWTTSTAVCRAQDPAIADDVAAAKVTLFEIPQRNDERKLTGSGVFATDDILIAAISRKACYASKQSEELNCPQIIHDPIGKPNVYKLTTRVIDSAILYSSRHFYQQN